MHLAISGLDLVNVYGSAPELKQSSRHLAAERSQVSGLWAVRHCLTAQLFSTLMSIYLGFFLAQIIIFEWAEKVFKTQNFETKKCF